MSTLTVEELDRLVQENRVLGGMDPEARRQLRESLEPVSVPGGSVLIREGDPADCMYLVAAGRMRVVSIDGAGEHHFLAEIGRGDLVGEMALITNRPRSATVYALRDTHLLRLSTDAFTRLVADHPESVRRISTEIVERLLRSQLLGRPSTPVVSVTLLPLDASAPVARFAERFEATVARLTGSARRIDAADATAAVGDELEGHRLAAWCSDLEGEYEVVVYQADPEPTAWTQACIRQADVLLLVADATTAPDLRPIERLAAESREVALGRTELVLVHPSWTEDPRGTSRWLARRSVDRHHHARTDRVDDADRVGRLVLSRGVGVVYSGGGARGIAEVGVLRALREAKVPIDAVGGTSIGSILAGATARGIEPTGVADLLTEALVTGKSPVDITFPAVSIAAGARVTQRIQEAAGGIDIEDAWVNAFCVSTNLTRGEIEVHRSGPGWFAVRASFSIPGVFPPMRNSEGDVLVDGGVLDNMPVGVMRSLHNGISVVAVDVGSKRDVRAGALPESGILNGWQWLLQRMNPRTPSPEMAGIIRVLMRITELGGGGSPDLGDLYIRPAVDGIAMLDFGAFDKLVELGYQAASTAIEKWLAEDTCPQF